RSNRVPVRVDADGEHLKFAILQGLVHRLHLRHFVDARTAPRRPEIQKDQLATVIAQFDGVPILILEREVRRLLTDVDNARLSDASHFFEDEIPRYRTDNQKENEGFRTCHVVIVSQVGEFGDKATAELRPSPAPLRGASLSQWEREARRRRAGEGRNSATVSL